MSRDLSFIRPIYVEHRLWRHRSNCWMGSERWREVDDRFGTGFLYSVQRRMPDSYISLVGMVASRQAFEFVGWTHAAAPANWAFFCKPELVPEQRDA